MPVTVLQQDWGAALGFDAAALWRAWAPDLRHRTVTCGHFMAEEAPAEIVAALRELLGYGTYSGHGSGKTSRYGRASSITRATTGRTSGRRSSPSGERDRASSQRCTTRA